MVARIKALSGEFEVVAGAASGVVMLGLLAGTVVWGWITKRRRMVAVAAVGLVVVMAGAIFVHARRGESSKVGVNVVLAALAIFVAWGRFGPHRF